MNGGTLVINAGSSSIKTSVFAPLKEPGRVMSGEVDGIGTQPHGLIRTAEWKVLFDQHWPAGDGLNTQKKALAILLRGFQAESPQWKPEAVGHRVVHGGTRFTAPTQIDGAVRQQLEELAALAPLHQPHNLKGIDAARAAFPDAAQRVPRACRPGSCRPTRSR